MDHATYTSPEPAEAVRLLAALGPRMLDLAAERAHGVHPYLVPPEHTAMARARLGPAPLLCPEQAVVLGLDRHDAMVVARRHVGNHLGYAGYVSNFRRLGWSDDDLADGGSDALLESMVAMGNVDAVVGRIREHLDAGADCVGVQVLPADAGTIPVSEWQQLAPALTELAASK
jgi:probable F420-dependent oxidoreductase